MKKFKLMKTTISVFATFFASAFVAVQAQKLPFAQSPAGTGSKLPAPNVIVSVDNSGSMNSSGINELKTALKEAFKPENVPDESIRLAYQSMWSCNTIPSTHSSCGGKNYMQVLKGKADPKDDSHRGRFLKWVDTLKDDGNTPSHNMMGNAGNYLMKTGVDSPWNAVPGVADSRPANCRRAYHILMTDGGWNYYDDYPMFNGEHKTGNAEIYNSHLDNADGTMKILPDGKIYNPDSPETRIYSDPWGRQTVDAGGGYVTKWRGGNQIPYSSESACKKETKNCSSYLDFDWRDVVPTLADQAFYYWSTDLQPSIENNVNPIVSRSEDETFKVGNKSQTLSYYWNPRNNPATWQHMINYTIGYKNAATWPTISTDPVFSDDTFGGDFPGLVVGSKKWVNPIQPPLHQDRMPRRDNKYWYTVPVGAERYGKNFNIGKTSYAVEVEEVRQQELWHIALNSRGKFIPAPEPEDLVKAFKDLITGIVVDNKNPITGSINNSSSLVRGDAVNYSGGYEAQGWKGFIRSDILTQGTGKITANEGWGTRPGGVEGSNHVTTADKLDALTEAQIQNRLVLTTNSDTGKGVLFEWVSNNSFLSASQKNLLNAANLGEARVNFIRGNRSQEDGNGNGKLRRRVSRQGDIVNSQVWYVAQPSANNPSSSYQSFFEEYKNRLPMIYVGGNDGMLHGFSAEDGSEKLAYVPKGIIKNLPELTHYDYKHRYYVDGSPFSGDVNRSSSGADNWRTLLIGTLGAGGKGYFVLDITQPGSKKGAASPQASTFTKAKAQDLVVLDQTWHEDDLDESLPEDDIKKDIGYIFSTPVVDEGVAHYTNQIALLNNGRWAAIMGNGYNSKNERPALLIQYLSGPDTALKTIPVTSGSAKGNGNGLSAPRLVDINGDGTPDVVYAGDIQGNLWKFDIGAANESSWGVAFSNIPLHVAKYTSGSSSTVQPITAPPIVKENNRGVRGMMVAYGTGINVTDNHRTDQSIQSLYSVIDKTQYKLTEGKVVVDTSFSAQPVAAGGGELVQQSVIAANSPIKGGQAGDKNMWQLTQNDVDFDKKNGWYLNFPASSERLLKNMSFFDGSNNLEVLSVVPASGGSTETESCSPLPQDAKAFRYFLNIMDGKRPSTKIVDTNGDGFYNSSDVPVSRMDAPLVELRFSAPIKPAGPTVEIRIPVIPPGQSQSQSSQKSADIFAKMPEVPLRPSWRQTR